MTKPEVIITKKNETYLHVEASDSVRYDIRSFFTIDVPGARFMPAYKKGWDGKLRLYNARTSLMYIGLLKDLVEFLQEKDRRFVVSQELVPDNNIPDSKIDAFLDSLKLPYEPRDYQRAALAITVNKNRGVLLSPTGSGKSLIIYSIIRYYERKKVLLVVPTLGLTTQMFSDFRDYSRHNGWAVEDNVHVITGGIEKDAPAAVYVSTWQSLYTQPKEYFHQFDVVLIDETHMAQANSIKKILENSTKAKVKIGLTGTLQDTKTHILTIQGLLGPIYKISKTHELQEREILAPIDVKMIMLEHSIEDRKKAKDLKYQQEIDFLLDHENRNKFIETLTIVPEGNTLVLTTFVDKQGKMLYEKLLKKRLNRPIFFISGEMSKEEREEIRKFTETTDKVIIIATYGVFSMGINIRRLHNIIFTLAGKSRIRNLQSIGRGLRTHETKEQLTLYDIGDDLSWNGKENYALKHFQQRYKQYLQENFNVVFSKVALSAK
jgi:superfamily II DNA or RNA helicase